MAPQLLFLTLKCPMDECFTGASLFGIPAGLKQQDCDWSGGCKTSQALQTKSVIWGLFLEDEDQLLLRVSSPLEFQELNTPKFGCSSSQMGFKLCSALLEGPVES